MNGLLESFYKNVFLDPVLPEPGSILKIDLALNPIPSACHTGIYVGRNRIVEMTNDDGTGIIKMVSPHYFLNYSLWRTGCFIYVACGKKDGKHYPLASRRFAERALAAVGNRTQYNFLVDNCHQFVEYCITGRKQSLIGTLEGVEAALKRELHLSFLESSSDLWFSTGVSLDGRFPVKKCWRCRGTGKITGGKPCDLCHAVIDR